jgi:hypothetical protein
VVGRVLVLVDVDQPLQLHVTLNAEEHIIRDQAMHQVFCKIKTKIILLLNRHVTNLINPIDIIILKTANI